MTRLLIGFTLLLSSTVFSQGLSTTEVIAADSLLNQWIVDHRVAEASKVYHDNFTLTTSAGKIKTKGVMLDEIGNQDLILAINKTENINVVLEGNTAVLTGRLHQKGAYKGKSFDNYLLVTDTWIYINKQWKIMAGHATLISQP